MDINILSCGCAKVSVSSEECRLSGINYESFSPENKTAKLFLASVIARLEVMGVVVGRGEKITAEIFEQEDESLIIYICGKDLINVRAKNTAEMLYGVVCETPRDVILKLKKLGNVENELYKLGEKYALLSKTPLENSVSEITAAKIKEYGELLTDTPQKLIDL